MLTEWHQNHTVHDGQIAGMIICRLLKGCILTPLNAMLTFGSGVTMTHDVFWIEQMRHQVEREHKG